MRTNHFPKAIGVALLLLATVLTSCTKEEDLTPTNPEPLSEFSEMSQKTLVLQDGESYVKLLVASPSPSALTTFTNHATLKVVGNVPAAESLHQTLPGAEAMSSDENAVHIVVLESHLAQEESAFSISVQKPEESGKADLYGVYSGGPYYFYSYDPNHYFKVTPRNGRCVSAWLYQKGSTWAFVSWAGGSGGNYICTVSWSAYSTVAHLDYRLKAQGADFSVTWY